MTPLEAIRDKLADLDVPVIIGEPEDSTEAPYVFIWAVTPVPHAHDLADKHADIDERIGITCVHTTVHNALILTSRTRDRVHNQEITATSYGTGRLTVVDSQPVTLDRTVKKLNNRYPAYGVLITRLQLPKEK